jgi:two-component system, LytTR family, response regulator
MIRAILIDDEENARKLLRSIIDQYIPEIEIIDECSDVPSAVKAIKRQKPDLIFLDIQMPVYSGLELFEFFNEEELTFDTIFVTAYNEHAIKAIKFSAFDYILKPIHHPELIESIEKYKEKQSKLKNQYELLKQNFSYQENWMDKRLIISTNKATRYIIPNEIIMIKADSAYSEIYTKDGSTLVVSKNLGYFQEILTPIKEFLRVHKSYIVNIKYIEEHHKMEGILKLQGNLKASITSDKTEELVSIIGL